jgi:hypothetical protein
VAVSTLEACDATSFLLLPLLPSQSQEFFSTVPIAQCRVFLEMAEYGGMAEMAPVEKDVVDFQQIEIIENSIMPIIELQ